MVFEEWAAFNTGLLMAIIFSIIIIVYFRLKERIFKLEKYLKEYKKTEETDFEEKEPKEV